MVSGIDMEGLEFIEMAEQLLKGITGYNLLKQHFNMKRLIGGSDSLKVEVGRIVALKDINGFASYLCMKLPKNVIRELKVVKRGEISFAVQDEELEGPRRNLEFGMCGSLLEQTFEA